MSTLTLPADGVLVTDAPPEHDEWFAARRGGITGTDLPKILGDSKYGNSLGVYLDKRGEAPEDEYLSEAGEWGHILEEPVAAEWASREDTKVERIGVIANAEHPWRRASLDRLVYGCDQADVCGLEVKTRSAFKAGSFRDDLPDDVLAQVAWGRLVSGLPHMHVAVLIGGQELRSFVYEPDETLESFLVAKATPVWEAVQDGTPPPVDPDADGVLLRLLNAMFDTRSGQRELDPAKAVRWVDQYNAGHETEKQGKALKEQAKAGLVQLIDDGDAGVLNGETVFTYKRPAPKDALTAAALRELAKDNPTTYADLQARGYITETQPGPRFTMKGQP